METHRTEITPGSSAVGQRQLPPELLRAKKYDIGGIVARGGMGAILEATEASIQRKVAMKVMLDGSSPEDLTRFISEAMITGQLEHPSIVPVYDLSVDENGQVFYTMKFVRGITLRKVLDLMSEGNDVTLKKYPLGAMLTVFQKLCDGIAFAHARGVIHRDLKPDNIMLGDFGEVLVMDWGLAKVLSGTSVVEAPRGSSAGLAGPAGMASPAAPVGPAGPAMTVTTHFAPGTTESITMAGSIMGTPEYMAPEQARGEVEMLDERSDIYSLGAILYHILTLRPSVLSEDVKEIVLRVSCGDIDPLTPAQKSRAIPDSLAAVCRKAMAVKPADRYQAVAALQSDLAAYQNGFATSAEKAGLGRVFILAVKRQKAVAAGIVAVLLVGLSFGTKAVVEARRAEREALRARQEAQHATQEAQRAEHEAERAATEGRRAERALAELKRQAPDLRQLAETEATLQRFESALDKVDAALSLDPAHLPGYWRRVWLLIGLERWNEAAAALRNAREKDPANASRAAILPLLDRFAGAPSDAARWTPGAATELFGHLRKVGASAEIARLSAKLRLGRGDTLALVRQRLDAWLGKAKGKEKGEGKGDAEIDAEGRLCVSVSADIATLEPLRGLPLEALKITRTRISSLEPLRGIPLQKLEMAETKVADLSPLAGMPLVSLNAHYTMVTDFRTLKGLPLQSLTLSSTQIRSLEPLRGMPLRDLNLGGTEVSDLTPLIGAPLEKLILGNREVSLGALVNMPLKVLRAKLANDGDLKFLQDAPLVELYITSRSLRNLSLLRGKTLQRLELQTPRLTDLSALRGAPIEELALECDRAADLSPLLELPQLQRFRILKPSEFGKLIEPLRKHPTLKSIAEGPWTAFVPAADFWAEYDARPTGKAGPK